MLANATVMNNAKLKAQQGFSLIELLVVVAIIGVLAAAGIVGYQSYLDGVKVDTQKNNILSLSRALQLADPARAGELSGVPYHCSRTEFPTGAANGPADADKTLRCIVSAAGGAEAFGKFKSPFDSRRFGVLDTQVPAVPIQAQQSAAASAVSVPVGDSNNLPYLKWKAPATAPANQDAATTFANADCSGNKDMLLAYAHDWVGPPLVTTVYIAGCNGSAELIVGSEQKVRLN